MGNNQWWPVGIHASCDDRTRREQQKVLNGKLGRAEVQIMVESMRIQSNNIGGINLQNIKNRILKQQRTFP